ncbi:MAG: amino acid transport protein [Gammaproteobacteria bacterium]|nr:amino acid transport protein [Gammaproteobacteria bacterium]
MDTTTIFLGLLFGAFGFGYFRYGKKQGAIVPLVCGITLMVFPFFVENTLLLVMIGIALIATPYFVRV